MERRLMHSLLIVIGFLFVSSLAYAGAEISIKWSFTAARDGEQMVGSKTLDADLLREEVMTSHPVVNKAMFLISISDAIKRTLSKFWEICGLARTPADTACRGKNRIADKFSEEIDTIFTRFRPGLAFWDPQIFELITVSRHLALNIKTFNSIAAFENITTLPMSGMSVATGGVQGWGHFKKSVNSGHVPRPKEFIIEGLLKEFNLALQDSDCTDLICLSPNWGYQPDTREIFIQISSESGVSEQDFNRKPLNLGLVVDVSGSMSATDETEKNRLQWAKEAALHAIDELQEGDVFSLVVFNQESKIIIPPGAWKDRDGIASLIGQLEPGGSTNLAAGLKDAFDLVETNSSPHFENRVIIISDAGLNVGETSTAEIQRMVAAAAERSVFLTAIGIGNNFNSELAESICNLRGGNYIFVNSGEEMVEYFQSFKFLTSPVAYDLNVEVKLAGLSAILNRVIGAAHLLEEGRTVLATKTLFLSPNKGGSIIATFKVEALDEEVESPAIRARSKRVSFGAR